MNVGELNDRGIKVHIIKGYGDTAVAERSIALMVAAAQTLRAWTAKCAPACGGARRKAFQLSGARRWA